MVPHHLWDRANAADSTGFVLAAVIGAPLAAVVAGLVGRPAALAATAAVFVAAGLSLLRMPRCRDRALGHRRALSRATPGRVSPTWPEIRP